MIHRPGTRPGLDAAGLDPLPAGLVYGQGTEAPVLFPSRRQIIASFKCILSVEGNSFSGCRQSACAELIVTVALIFIPARPRSLPPVGTARVRVSARCWGHPGCPHRSRAWPHHAADCRGGLSEPTRVPSAHLLRLAASRRGAFLAPPGAQPLFAIRESPWQGGRSWLLGVCAASRGWGANCRQKTGCFCPPSVMGGSGCPSPAGGWVLAGVAQRLSYPPTQGTGGDTCTIPRVGFARGRAGHRVGCFLGGFAL